jgi:hypothetical protein
MTKEQLAKLVAEGLSVRQIAQRANTSYTNTRYWLKQYGFKTNCRAGRKPKELSRLRKCACGETDPNKFYGNKFWLCAKCWNAYSVRKNREKSAWARVQLGDKCGICGFNRYKAALTIHHLDPAQKDVAFRSMRSWSFSRIAEELKKCILLCSNCHLALHAGEVALKNPRRMKT